MNADVARNLLALLLSNDRRRVADEYWTRFIVPQLDRADALGYDSDAMLDEAFDESDWLVTFPAYMLRDAIDARIAYEYDADAAP